MPSHFHLLVQTAQKLQFPIFTPAHQITSAIQTCPGYPTEAIRHKPFRRQPRSPQVATRQTRPAHVQLARDSTRRQLPVAVQHVHPHPGDWTTNRWPAGAGFSHAPRCRDDGVLRWPIVVDECKR